MDSISLIRTPIEAELGDFKELFDSSLSSSNALLDSVVSHIRQRNGKMMRPILVLLVAEGGTCGVEGYSYMSGILFFQYFFEGVHKTQYG